MPDEGAPPSSPAHVFHTRVYWEDTDGGGIVYHANYLRFAERARTELLRSLDIEHTALRAREGLILVVRRCTLEFLRPARLDDLLAVETRLAKGGRASMTLDQRIRRDETDLVAITVTIACINDAGQPARLPASLRTALGAATTRTA